MKLRFIGTNGSMGLKFGEIYQVSVETKRNGKTQMTRPVMCPYDSDEAFARNWADPRVDIRKEFENTPTPREIPARQCSRTEIHGSHNWQTLSTAEPYAWCQGKTDKEQV